jgi:hypothetical protein
MTAMNPRGELAALIDGIRARNQWTDRQVVQNAKSAGHQLTTSDVSLYRISGMKNLVPTKVVALAAGLRTPPYRVAVAVLADLGIEVPLEARTPEAAIQHDTTLSAKAKDWLLSILERERVDNHS